MFLAEDEFVLSRVLALKVVASCSPGDFGEDALERVRVALLEERWADAVGEWIATSGEAVDGYPDEVVWTGRQLDEDVASMEIRMAPIFRDS